MAAAGRGKHGRAGYNYQSVAEYDRRRKETILAFSKVLFSAYPGLEKTGEMRGDGVKYLHLFYRLNDDLVFCLKVSESALSPILIGPATEVDKAVRWLTQKQPDLMDRFKIYEPRGHFDSALSDLGTHRVEFMAKFLDIETYAPLLKALDYAVTQKKAA